MSENSKYYWIREIARGGMGQVDLIVRSEGSFRKLLAVKRLHPKFLNDKDCRTMFLDEARIAGMLKHANIVRVFDVGEDEQGPFLMMEYIDGMSLQSVLRSMVDDRAVLPIAVAVQIAMQAAEGLHAAHELRSPDGAELKLVHRDISPQNVMVGYDGIARVMDFGIAHAIGRTTKTSTGILKGKVAYMSPEQLRFHPVDRRSDLFALGVLLYEMLTSKRLYSNKDGDGPRRILEESPPDVGFEREGISPALVELVFELLAKDPDERPNTALEVAQRLRETLNDLMLDDTEAIELGAYVRHRFEAETTGHQRAIKDALKLLDEDKLPPWPLPEPTIDVVAPARSKWPIVAGAVAVCAALGVGIYIGGDSDSGEKILVEPTENEQPQQATTKLPTDMTTDMTTAAVVKRADLESMSTESVQMTTSTHRRKKRRGRRVASRMKALKPVVAEVGTKMVEPKATTEMTKKHDPLAPAAFGSIGGK